MNEYYLLEKQFLIIGILLFFLIGFLVGVGISDWMLVIRGLL